MAALATLPERRRAACAAKSGCRSTSRLLPPSERRPRLPCGAESWCTPAVSYRLPPRQSCLGPQGATATAAAALPRWACRPRWPPTWRPTALRPPLGCNRRLSRCCW